METDYVRKCIKAGAYKLFSAVPTTVGQQILLVDLLRILRGIDNDLKKITPQQLGAIVPVVLGLSSFTVAFAQVASRQGSFERDGDMTLEEGAMNEVAIKVKMAANAAQGAIDVGNKVAEMATGQVMTAEDVVNAMSESPNVKISRNVAARARGPMREIEFDEATKVIGGDINIPSEFARTCIFNLKGCRVTADLGKGIIKILCEVIADDLAALGFGRSGEISLHVDTSTFQGKLIQYMLPAGVKFDAKVGISEKLVNRKTKLFLMEICEPVELLAKTLSRLQALTVEL